ncbi:peptide-N4-(N-acetyl-beta-glucosaminyl)asparagine amidase A [Sorghum bicolor]|uniref:peptide-N4-(N-acetyl-beta- glucosaminyl)asparagine amidase A n=1 Tax=Sorghum bicolor TaxID=4558 RepID=UPI0001A84356|nr:peptide-N4-(N-acetyl-beta-glucosaminyl)asparagine amidase A [Sorghum bicolor]|eukprot:XP_002454966.1 peptide-N4-(N-acetyl-beta-glucosaminyl)asparagine amidase A [Sorghum bicolor]
MASSYVPFLLVFLMASLVPLSIASLPHKLRLSASDVAALKAVAPRSPAADQPTIFFQVDRPHRPPPGSSGPCSTLLLSHSFAYAYGKPPATAAYSPPPCLTAAGGRASAISLAVLEWRATCRGNQCGRVFGVWLGGAELLRGCTAEPPIQSAGGVEWTVSKNVTKYASLLAARDSTTLAVYLGNIVGQEYNGVLNANVTLHLYFRHTPPPPQQQQPGLGPADAVVPISRSLPLNDGLWFEILNDFYDATASVTVPTNTYRAVLEVYLSYQSGDEYWYGNADDGPFREVVVQIDGDLVGVVWPFPVVYSGGIDPMLWRPITGIGSFNLPSYDIELTAFLGKLLDGEKHEVRFTVTNAIDTWFVDANLHLWLDPRGTATAAGMISYDAPPLDTATATLPDGSGYMTAFRNVSASGWVQTRSYGKFTATWTQRLGYENTMRFRDSYLKPEVNQTTDAYSAAHVADRAGGVLYSQEAQQSFTLYKLVDVGNADLEAYSRVTKVRLGFREERVAAGRSGSWARSLSNSQECAGVVDVEYGETVRESWDAHQTYRYEASDACYFRNVTSHGNDVVSDHSDEACVKGSPAGGIAERAVAAGTPQLSSY